MFIKIILIFLVFVIVFPAISAGGASQTPNVIPGSELKMISQIGGPTQAVALKGKYAFVGVGSRLVVLDVSVPDTPIEIGSSGVLGGNIEDVVVAGGTAFVAAGGAGLYAIDISNPSKPEIMGICDTPGYAEGVAVSGRYAYIADGPSGLRIIDIVDLKHPKEISSIYTKNYIFDVAIYGKCSYLAAAGAGMLSADISDPVRPKAAGSFDTPGYVYGLAVSAGIAYIADGWGGVIAIDVSKSNAPRQVGFLNTQGWAFDVAVSGNTAFIADSYKGLRTVDISNRTKLVETGCYEVLKGDAHKLAVGDGIVYVADRSLGLQIIDVAKQGAPILKGRYSQLGFADDVAVSGNYACVATGLYGELRILDVKDPAKPGEVGRFDTGDYYATGLVAAGHYVFMITNLSFPSGLNVIDISDPANPFGVGFLELDGAAQDIVLKDGIAYVVNEKGLYLIDVTDPGKPVISSYLDFSGGDDAKATQATWGVTVDSNTAYVAYSGNGLKIVNVANPRNPYIIKEYKPDTFIKVMSVAVNNGFAFVTDHPLVHSADVRKPSNPSYSGGFNLPERAERITYAGSTIFIADGPAGLQTVNASNPAKMSSSGSYSLPGYAYGLTVSGNCVYVADGYGGLVIFKSTRSLGTDSQKSTGKTADLLKIDSGKNYPTEKKLNTKAKYVKDSSTITDDGSGALPLGSGNTWSVTSTGDNGPGSFRQVLESVNSGDIITFGQDVFPAAKPSVIHLETALPQIKKGNITIDASNSGVILDGRGLKDNGDGLVICSSGNIVKGLQIINFRNSGISIESRGNVIGGDRTKGRGPIGEGNLISCNFTGIALNVRNASNNRITGNFIGTDISGKKIPGKQDIGISIYSGASNNIIGGNTEGGRNIISGNEFAGINISDEGTQYNKIIGNYIGTDVNGIFALGQVTAGIFITSGASNNMIGGAGPAEKNVISGNKRAELSIMFGANSNTISGNYIGVDASGKKALGASVMGLSVEGGGLGNIISKNVINGGVMISDSGSNFNRVTGNFIGISSDCTTVFGNPNDGISLNASFNVAGGTGAGEGNIICGGLRNGIKIGFTDTIGNIVLGNSIGITGKNMRIYGNASNGICITEGSKHTIIGGATKAEGNTVGGNGDSGIKLEGTGVNYNIILGNYVGTDISCKALFGNKGDGINIDNGNNNFGQDNCIGNNKKTQVFIKNGSGNAIYRNNFIGRKVGFDYGTGNFWYTGSQGNYWSDYKGKDLNKDGIGDTPYKIPDKGVDRFPVMKLIKN